VQTWIYKRRWRYIVLCRSIYLNILFGASLRRIFLVRVHVNEEPSSGITLAERGAIGCLSFFAATGTVVFLAAILAYADPSIVLSYAFVLAATVFVVAASIAGFILGPDRAVQWWGIIWGTEPRNRWQTALIVAIIAVVALAAIYEHWQW
jgi:hypothetical protein